MDRKAFALLSSMEKSWWYRGRARVVAALMRRFVTTRGNVLDYGAGSGGMYPTLSAFGSALYGFEPNDTARSEAASRGYIEMYADESLIQKQKYSLVAFCDVLEHTPDDTSVLRAIRDTLSTDGRVVITVPAYQWMWSTHDVSHHHYRRYTQKQVRELLTKSGFDVEFAGYWNMFLFPLALVLRLIGTSGEGSLGLPAVVNEILLSLIRIETWIMRIVPLPFGLSVVAVGRIRE